MQKKYYLVVNIIIAGFSVVCAAIIRSGIVFSLYANPEYQLLDDISKVFCVCIFRDS